MKHAMSWLIVMGAIWAAATPATGQQAKPADKPEPYVPVGAPKNPKVPGQWNRFYDHAAATRFLHDLARAHPDFCRLQSLGKSTGGREMWVMTITNFAKGKEAEKPGFWIDGGIHANEIQGVEVVLYTAWFLLEMRQQNDVIGRMVDERVFYLLPMLSPDSRDAHMYEPNTTHSPRTGQIPVDDDEDGLFNEDGPDDLDGDGHITQMRIRDPNGRFKPHDEYPQLMIRVKPEEKGQYTLLGEEGFDNDGDGRVNEDGDGFYDPNRDWPWNWQPPHQQRGTYRYPFSVPENRMAGDFIMAHPNIAGAQSYHNTGGFILRGPGAREDRYEQADINVYDLIGQKGQRMLPGYKYIDVLTGLYPAYGGEFDWIYQMRGTFAFTNELFTKFNFFREATEGGGFFADAEKLHEFDKLLLFGEGFVKWREVDHPQYGKVEVGGFKKNWVRQPPSFLLEEECHRNAAFTLYHADQMPLVKVQSVTVKDLDGGLKQVDAVVVNERLTPTRSAIDVRRRITPPDVVSISGQGLTVIAGLIGNNLTYDRVTEQKRTPAEMRIDSIGGMDAVYVRWIVKGDGPFTVTARSIKGGGDAMTK